MIMTRRPEHPAPHRHRVSSWLTGLILAGPPAAWVIQMTAGEFLSAGGCKAFPVRPVLLIISGICFIAASLASIPAWRQWRRTRHEKTDDKPIETGEGRTRFLALLGLLESGLFSLAIIITAIALAGTPACTPNALAPTIPPADMSRGAYVAKLGDCVSCHSLPGRHDFAGGFPLHSPLGTIYGSNITPDPKFGIGCYSRADFRRAVREGVARGGRHLYPAMPYPSFAGMSDADTDALYDYFMREVPPIAEPAPETKLHFPFNQRWAIRFWNLFFLSGRDFRVQAGHDPQWNRGAYLVQTIAHCGACHTPRGLAYEERATGHGSRLFLSGSDVDKWYAANLTADPDTGLGHWTESDIAEFLQTGAAHGGMAFGSMQQVVENSGQYMTPADRQAIARYLKSLPEGGKDTDFTPAALPAGFEPPAAGMYAQLCAGCHQAQGEGIPEKIPRLAGNPIVLSSDPRSQIRLILEGGATARTQAHPETRTMPAFARLSDREIAGIVTYLRRNWGNAAPAVSARQVASVRKDLSRSRSKPIPRNDNQNTAEAHHHP
jgi:mono/diheme cytochrome c family protein